MPEMRRLGDPDPAFNPRLAAMSHAAMASAMASGRADSDNAPVLAEFANAVASGLVYVGDEIGRLLEREPGTPVVLATPEAVTRWLVLRDEIAGGGPSLTFAEMSPVIRDEANRLLAARRRESPQDQQAIITATLEMAQTIIDNKGGCRVSAGG